MSTHELEFFFNFLPFLLNKTKRLKMQYISNLANTVLFKLLLKHAQKVRNCSKWTTIGFFAKNANFAILGIVTFILGLLMNAILIWNYSNFLFSFVIWYESVWVSSRIIQTNQFASGMIKLKWFHSSWILYFLNCVSFGVTWI